jgi:hypothetical protein
MVYQFTLFPLYFCNVSIFVAINLFFMTSINRATVQFQLVKARIRQLEKFLSKLTLQVNAESTLQQKLKFIVQHHVEAFE